METTGEAELRDLALRCIRGEAPLMDPARMIAEWRGVSVGAVLFGKCEEVRRFLKSGGSCGAPAGPMECLSLAATPRLFLRALKFV